MRSMVGASRGPDPTCGPRNFSEVPLTAGGTSLACVLMTEKGTANIGTPQRVPLTDLNLYHKNPRLGDVQAIKGSIVANGVFRPVVVNKGTYTDKPNEILAGNHTVKAIRELAEEHPDDARWQHVDVWMVDVDAERAARIVLADNRTADLGSYDNGELLGLLETVDYDLDGTGYDYGDVDDLRSLVEDGGAAPGSAGLLDEPETDNYRETYAVTVVCADAEEQEKVFNRLTEEGYDCKVVTV